MRIGKLKRKSLLLIMTQIKLYVVVFNFNDKLRYDFNKMFRFSIFAMNRDFITY